jgi:hypothetical protein
MVTSSLYVFFPKIANLGNLDAELDVIVVLFLIMTYVHTNLDAYYIFSIMGNTNNLKKI